MSEARYTWSTLSGDDVQRYRLGVDKALAKRFTDDDAFVRELYYAQVVREQPWASSGFLRPIGWHYADRVVFYPYAEVVDLKKIGCYSYPPPDKYLLDNLVFALYWLSRADLFALSVQRDQLRVMDRYVVLADYQLVSLSDVLTGTGNVGSEILQLTVARLRTVRDQRARLREFVFESVYTAMSEKYPSTLERLRQYAVETPPVRWPSLVPSLQEYVDQLDLTERERTQPPRQIGRGAHACVYAPPIDCPSLVELPGRFVGKVFKLDTVEYELAGAPLMDEVDPRGEYHARFIAHCSVSVPDDCQPSEELGPSETTPELIYEYRGQPLGPWVLSDDPVRRLRFYVGLSELIGHVVEMNHRDVYHFDLRYDNVVADQHYHLSIIDYGSVVRGRDIRWGDVNYQSYFYYPIEVGLVDSFGKSSVSTMRQKWRTIVNYSRQHNQSFDSVLAELHDVDTSSFEPLIDRLYQQLSRLSPSERLAWIRERLDLYTLGYSLAVNVAYDTNYFDELRPVLYHLVAYDVYDRDVALAQRELKKLVERLERQVAVPFTD